MILVRSTSFFPASQIQLPMEIMVNQEQISVSALVDSRFEQNLISQDLVNQLAVPTQALQTPLVARLTGQRFAMV